MADSTFWESNLVSALIGAGAALLVVIVQNWQEQKKEETNERNKLVYLDFLIKDVYRVVDRFDQQANTLETSFADDPFVIPTTHQYPPHSLEEISLRLKQEDYYLASAHQLKNKDVAEVLRICNTLHQTYALIIAHYLAETPKFIQDKMALEDSLTQLVEGMNQLVLAAEGNRLSTDEMTIYNQIHDLLGKVEIMNRQPHSLRDTKVNLIDNVIAILKTKGRKSHRDLLIKAYEARDQYEICMTRSKNVMKSMTHNRDTMNEMVGRIQASSTSLTKFVEQNQTD